jgi:hypothetical protein
MPVGTWLATVRFPDGTELYVDYSTVVESVCPPLHPSVCREGGTLPGGDHCYRDEAVGEPLPSWPDRPLSAFGDLLVVTVERQPYDEPWHALYCPSRGRLLGPLSGHYQIQLQQDYDLARDDDGVRHLCAAGGPRTACGVMVSGASFGLFRPAFPGSEEHYPQDPGPFPDVFADWNAPDMCRLCLWSWLTTPPPAPPEPGPEPSTPRRWWRFGRRSAGR